MKDSGQNFLNQNRIHESTQHNSTIQNQRIIAEQNVPTDPSIFNWELSSENDSSAKKYKMIRERI
jgi:hypothetical protein